MKKTIAIIGAGAKACAIAARLAVLKRQGIAIPTVHVFEKHAVAANWSGDYDYTDGSQLLGTSPEKDVGFPYKSHENDGIFADAIQQGLNEFSWVRYLQNIGRYADWVDRQKPAPSHKLWSSYLQWVMDQAAEVIHYHRAEVIAANIIGDRWCVHYQADGMYTQYVDSVVLSGPGKQNLDFSIPESNHIISIDKFWHQLLKISQYNCCQRIAVIGSGESAASCSLALSKMTQQGSTIDLITTYGLIHSRGEGYYENRLFSDPEAAQWAALSLSERQAFIARTDTGVFSPAAIRMLAENSQINCVKGRVTAIEEIDGKLILQGVEMSNNQGYDKVILATGFSQVRWLQSLCNNNTLDILAAKLGIDELNDYNLSLHIEKDFSLANIKQKLHIPMLAGLMQGPGFPNLSSLGAMSARLIDTYVSVAKGQSRCCGYSSNEELFSVSTSLI